MTLLRDRIRIFEGDITTLVVDAIVNAANETLLGGGRREAELLRSCYRRCFRIAGEQGIRSIAFPAISTGVYGYPLKPATRIALTETRDQLSTSIALEQVVFACFGADATRTYREVLDEVFGGLS